MKHHVLLIDLSFLAEQDRFHFGLPTAGFWKAGIMLASTTGNNPPSRRERCTVAVMHRSGLRWRTRVRRSFPA
jgi:hypothetical protein